MSHWQTLGLEPEADERSIKRAYAKLLKVHRPDEDAAAFQQLREAYESALAQARWRVEYEEEEQHGEVQAENSVVPVDIPVAAFEVPAPVQVVPDYLMHIASVPEPAISMNLIRQWLDEGQERRVVDALPGLLGSEALLSFDRRQAFEEQLLECLEESEYWTPELFERIARLMGWDDERGHLPCAGWRWHRLLDRCHAAAELTGLRRDLDGPRPERALSFVFSPLTDIRRRRLADNFLDSEWQHCATIAERVEHHSEALRQRLGLEVQPGWRDWMPGKTGPLFLYVWLMILPMLVMNHTPANQGWTVVDVGHVAILGLISAGLAFWLDAARRRIATWLVDADITLSQGLLPARLYRRGAGLLVLRHLLPAVAVALTAAWWLRASPWWQWAYPLLMLPVLLGLVDASLRGKLPMPWDRLYRGLTRPTQETGW